MRPIDNISEIKQFLKNNNLDDLRLEEWIESPYRTYFICLKNTDKFVRINKRTFKALNVTFDKRPALNVKYYKFAHKTEAYKTKDQKTFIQLSNLF